VRTVAFSLVFGPFLGFLIDPAQFVCYDAISMNEFQEHLNRARLTNDQDSWRYLIELVYGHLLRKAIRLTHNATEAEEFVASFMLYLVERDLIHKYRGTSVGEFCRFLTICLTHHILNARKVREVADQEYIDQIVIYEDPSLSITNDEIRRALDESISQLRFEQRAVILLETNYTQREISIMLGGINPNTIASHSRRARSVLRSLLKRKGIGPLSILP